MGIGYGFGVPLVLGVLCVLYLLVRRQKALAKDPAAGGSLPVNVPGSALTMVPPSAEGAATASTRAFFDAPIDPVNPAHIAIVDREIEMGSASAC